MDKEAILAWIYGLLSVFIGGAASGASTIVAGMVLSEHVSWKLVGMTALSGGVIAVIAYLKKSPLPKKGKYDYYEETNMHATDVPEPPAPDRM